MALITRTTQDSRRLAGPAAVLFAGVAALAGTGGITHAPTDIGYTLPGVRLQPMRRATAASAQLRRVMSNLAVSHAAMARVLGVSRQAMYNWLNGAEPTGRHQATLAALDEVHAILADIGMPMGVLLTKPLRDGQSFWDLVRAGERPAPLAELIRDTYQRRSEQRTLVAQRLTAKRAKGIPADSPSDDPT